MLAVLLLLGCGVLAAGRLLESESETRSPARVAAAQPTEEPVKSKFRCEIGTSASGITVDVKGSDHKLRSAPSPTAGKIVNEKASKILGGTHYHSIDSSTRVQVQCEHGEWARVQIKEPDWLTHVTGWVERVALAEPRRPGEPRTFTTIDVAWDKDTAPHKDMILRALNRILEKIYAASNTLILVQYQNHQRKANLESPPSLLLAVRKGAS